MHTRGEAIRNRITALCLRVKHLRGGPRATVLHGTLLRVVFTATSARTIRVLLVAAVGSSASRRRAVVCDVPQRLLDVR